MKKYRDQLVKRIKLFKDIPVDAMKDSHFHRLDELETQLKEFDKVWENMNKEMAVSEPEESPEDKRYYPASLAKKDSESKLKQIIENSMEEKDWSDLEDILNKIKEYTSKGQKYMIYPLDVYCNHYLLGQYLQALLSYDVTYRTEGGVGFDITSEFIITWWE